MDRRKVKPKDTLNVGQELRNRGYEALLEVNRPRIAIYSLQTGEPIISINESVVCGKSSRREVLDFILAAINDKVKV